MFLTNDWKIPVLVSLLVKNPGFPLVLRVGLLRIPPPIVQLSSTPYCVTLYSNLAQLE